MSSMQGPVTGAPKGAAYGAPLGAQGYPYAAPSGYAGYGAAPAVYGAMPYGYSVAPFGVYTPFGYSKAPGFGPYGGMGKAPYWV